MKILQTARWFFPHTGGGSIRVFNIARNLVTLGHEVHLLVHHPKSIDQCNLNHNADMIPTYENYQGIHLYRLPYYPPTSLYWALSIPLMTRKAFELIHHNNLDIVLSDNPPYLIGVASLIAAKLAGVPMVINVHDVWGASHYSSLQYKIGAALERFCTSRVDRFVTVSEGLRMVLAQNFKIPIEKIGVAANAIDLSRFNVDQPTIEQILARYPQFNLQPDQKFVIFVGILRQWAGVQYLIEAFAKVVEFYPELRLLLIGGGGDKPYFESLAAKYNIANQVIFTDSLPYQDIPAFISRALIACAPFPSSRVTDQKQLMSPLKVLEYMAAGKAVIASRVGGMENYIIDHETGLMFTPGDVNELAAKICYLIQRPQLIQDLGQRARAYVQQEKFGWVASARVVEAALNYAMNHHLKVVR